MVLQTAKDARIVAKRIFTRKNNLFRETASQEDAHIVLEDVLTRCVIFIHGLKNVMINI